MFGSQKGNSAVVNVSCIGLIGDRLDVNRCFWERVLLRLTMIIYSLVRFSRRDMHDFARTVKSKCCAYLLHEHEDDRCKKSKCDDDGKEVDQFWLDEQQFKRFLLIYRSLASCWMWICVKQPGC
jgi:hypothetical protein